MSKVALITGGARRIGAVIAQTLHQQGYRVAIHYHHHHEEAQALCDQLNTERSESAITIAADFNDVSSYSKIITTIEQHFGRLDALINNASSYFATPFGQISEQDWHSLFNSNAKAPLFITQAAAPLLKANHGSVVNIIDINSQRPKRDYLVYCMAKTSLVMLTKGLALELGPTVRVNGVSPGAIIWPESPNEMTEDQKQLRIQQSYLKKKGEPEDIAQAVSYFLKAPFVTGQILSVDGGRP